MWYQMALVIIVGFDAPVLGKLWILLILVALCLYQILVNMLVCNDTGMCKSSFLSTSFLAQ